MHIHVVYVKEELPFAWDLSLEFLIMFSTGFTSFSALLLFFLCSSPSSTLCTLFDAISSNIDEVLLINPSANVFVFGDFNVHHKDWLTYSGGSDRLVKSVIILSQKTLLRWLTFLLTFKAVTLTVLLFRIYLFLLTLVFAL